MYMHLYCIRYSSTGGKNTYFRGRANHFKYIVAVDLELHTGEVFASVYVGYATRGRAGANRSH